MHIQPRHGVEHVLVADAIGGRLVQAGGIAQHALDEVVEQRQTDIGQHQTGDRFIDVQPARSQPLRPIQNAPIADAGHRHAGPDQQPDWC